MKNTRLTFEEVKQFIEVYSNSDCELQSTEYIRSKDKLQILCKCGELFETTFDKFKSQNKRQCNKCSIENSPQCQPKTLEKFKEEVFTLTGSEYEVVGEYKRGGIKIKIKHQVCGNTYEVTPNHFLNGDRCSFCYVCRRKTNQEFVEEVFQLVKDEYKFLDEYKNNHTKISVVHNVCGCEYKVTPKDFLRGNRCPQCNESKGEKIIADYLKANNITFDRQFIIDECKNIKPLPFDFKVTTIASKSFLIEYDGEFHYMSLKGKRHFEYQQMLDKIKTDYCLKNNIPLLRIPYWEFDNIESIIENYILELDNQQIAQ